MPYTIRNPGHVPRTRLAVLQEKFAASAAGRRRVQLVHTRTACTRCTVLKRGAVKRQPKLVGARRPGRGTWRRHAAVPYRSGRQERSLHVTAMADHQLALVPAHPACILSGLHARRPPRAPTVVWRSLDSLAQPWMMDQDRASGALSSYNLC